MIGFIIINYVRVQIVIDELARLMRRIDTLNSYYSKRIESNTLFIKDINYATTKDLKDGLNAVLSSNSGNTKVLNRIEAKFETINSKMNNTSGAKLDFDIKPKKRQKSNNKKVEISTQNVKTETKE